MKEAEFLFFFVEPFSGREDIKTKIKSPDILRYMTVLKQS